MSIFPSAFTNLAAVKLSVFGIGVSIYFSNDLFQDRCYSRTFESSTEVEKGCTQSQSCLGTTTCCQGDFCNAGNFF